VRGGVVERNAYFCLIAFRADEGVDQGTQPLKRRSLGILENDAPQLGRLSPFIALKPEEDGGLVRKILIHRSDTDSGPLGYARRGEPLRALFSQNLNSSFQNRRDKLCRASLFGLFS
jgi:hypothetical protein